MDIRDHVSVDADVCHGQPCFKGTRIMVYLVLELLEQGVPTEKILSDYYPSLTPASIRAALHYAAQLIRDRDFIPAAR